MVLEGGRAPDRRLGRPARDFFRNCLSVCVDACAFHRSAYGNVVLIKVWLISVRKAGSLWSFWREQIWKPRKDVSARVKGRRFSASVCSRALRAGAGRHAEPVRQLAASDVSGEHAADASGRGGGIPARRRRVRATREPVADVRRPRRFVRHLATVRAGRGCRRRRPAPPLLEPRAYRYARVSSARL